MLLLFFALKILCNDWIIYTELYFNNLLVVTARWGFFSLLIQLSADKDTISTLELFYASRPESEA